jgi:hypothetical protein
MIYNFNFNIEKDGSPYGTTDTAAIYIAQELERRITSDKPLLEYRISTELKSTSEVVLTETEKNHLLSVLTSLQIDNYFKGQLTHPLVTDVVDGVPVKVTRWQLRAELAIRGLENNVTTAISNLPTGTQSEQELKIKAQYAWDYSNYIERDSPTVSMIQMVLGLTNSEVDDIFISAYQIEI